MARRVRRRARIYLEQRDHAEGLLDHYRRALQRIRTSDPELAIGIASQALDHPQVDGVPVPSKPSRPAVD